MKTKLLTAFLLLLVTSTQVLALRPSLTILNTRVNQLEAENNAQQAEIDTLSVQVDTLEDRTADLCALYERLSDMSLIGDLQVPLYCYGPVYEIGDVGAAGGIVFYITDGGLHGLEAAPVDQTSAEWGCEGLLIPGADGTAIGYGPQNTADILARCSTADIAAAVAGTYTFNGYSDWFLPSQDELNELFLRKDVVGGFAEYGIYWSSTEIDYDHAWSQGFYSGTNNVTLKSVPFRVRAVRAF